jgi:hypothetical protein
MSYPCVLKPAVFHAALIPFVKALQSVEQLHLDFLTYSFAMLDSDGLSNQNLDDSCIAALIDALSGLTRLKKLHINLGYPDLFWHSGYRVAGARE